MFVTLFKIKKANRKRRNAIEMKDKNQIKKISQEIEAYEMRYIELRSLHKHLQLQYDNFK